MTKNRPPILLSEAFPDFLDDKGIFSAMSGMPWSDEVDSDLLDMDYFGNHSGWKKCSPLVYRLFDDEYELSDAARQKLADLVMAKFGPNWIALWNTYHAEYDPLLDYSLTESGTTSSRDTRTSERSAELTEGASESGALVHGQTVTQNNSVEQEDSNSVTYGHRLTSTGNTQQDDDTTLVHGETITSTESVSKDDLQSKWGFDSAVAVPTDEMSSKIISLLSRK